MCNILTDVTLKLAKASNQEINGELKWTLTKKNLLMFCNAETVYKFHLHVYSVKVYSPSSAPLRNSKEQIYTEI